MYDLYFIKVYGFSYKPFKKWVELEPLVEFCPKNILCTDECAVVDLNLMKTSTADLDFSNEFKVTIDRDGYMNGIVLWFDTLFSFGQRTIKLTTRNVFLKRS